MVFTKDPYQQPDDVQRRNLPCLKCRAGCWVRIMQHAKSLPRDACASYEDPRFARRYAISRDRRRYRTMPLLSDLDHAKKAAFDDPS